MPYLSIAVVGALVVAGVAVLAALLIRLQGSRRRLLRTARPTRSMFCDRTGLLTARLAALRVELGRRRARSGRATEPRDHPHTA